MAQQTIGIGAVANDGTGDTIRDAFDKANDNFTELYTGLTGLLDFKGSTDCSTNPNYPAASKGDFYLVSVAGKIGGASGIVVEVGDTYFATADNAGGTQASVGTSWTVVQGNITSYLPLTGGTLSGDLIVPAEAYGGGWDGSNEVPTKNDVYDKIEAVIAGAGTISVLDDVPDVNVPTPSDGDVLTWDNGAGEWVSSAPTGGGGGGTGEAAFTPPLSSSFTLQNAGTSSVSDVTGGMYLDVPSTSSNIRFLKYTAGPASFTSFTMTIRAQMMNYGSSGSYPSSLIMRNSGSGRIIIMTNSYLKGSQFLGQRWSAYTTFNASIFGTAIGAVGAWGWPWQRIVVAGGTITYSVSATGDTGTWITVGTETVATYITSIDEVGIGAMTNSDPASCLFQSFTIA